jgi:tetratricopeptide (TPR) repeat protein
VVRGLALALLVVGGSAAWAQRPVARALAEHGQQAVRSGKLRQAAVLFERALRADPDYLPAYAMAVPVWLELGELEDAARQLERLTLRHPDQTDGWYALALVYRRSGRFAESVMAYEVYLRMRPDEADPYFGLGVALGRLGQHRRAQWAYGRYIELSDGSDEFAAEARFRRFGHGLKLLLPAEVMAPVGRALRALHRAL